MEDNNVNDVPVNKEVEKNNNKNLVMGIIIAVLVVIILVLCLIISVLNNPMKKFKNNLNTASGMELEELYQNIEDSDDKDEAEKIFKDNVKLLVENYANGTIGYEDVIGKLKSYEDSETFEKYYKENLKNIESLKVSKDNFELAEENCNEEKFVEAIELYKKVSKEDKQNYDVAQTKIEDTTTTLKNKVLDDVEEYVLSGDYISAKASLDYAEPILGEDSDFVSKKTEIETKAEEQIINNAKSNQELEVLSAKIVVQDTRYKSLYPDLLQVIVQNNTQKTVRSYEISILGYDRNGLPVKIEGKYDFSGGYYEFRGNAEDANITPGQKHGSGKGWELDSEHNVSKIKALVTKVSYYDGTEWENEYYEYWLEEYKERPIND